MVPSRSRPRVGRSRAAAVGLLALALTLLATAPANAGRGFFTGHDADDHCAGNEAQCQLLRVAVAYVRGGAPDPARPVLALACTDRVEAGLANAFGAGAVPVMRVCPSTDPGWPGLALTPSAFSAIVVGSTGDSINTAGAVPVDSDAIARRKGDIAAFFNAGGGLLALAGDQFGDGDPATGPDTYYDFVPLPAVGKKVTGPFRLTPEGQALGIEDSTNGIGTVDAINCCPTHNSFNDPPPGSALRVAELDSSTPPAPESLFAEGTISGGTIVTGPPAARPPAFGPGGVISAPSNRRCVSRRNFRIRVRERRGRKYESVIVFVNGKRVAVRRGARVTAPVDLRGLPKGRFTVRITVITTTGEVIVGTRRYRTCVPRRRAPSSPL